MKKKIALFLTLLLAACSAGCGKEEPSAPAVEGQEVQTEIRLAECGLAYTIPEEWVTMEDANLIPASYVDLEGEIYAKIQYNFVPSENMAALASRWHSFGRPRF